MKSLDVSSAKNLISHKVQEMCRKKIAQAKEKKMGKKKFENYGKQIKRNQGRKQRQLSGYTLDTTVSQAHISCIKIHQSKDCTICHTSNSIMDAEHLLHCTGLKLVL